MKRLPALVLGIFLLSVCLNMSPFRSVAALNEEKPKTEAVNEGKKQAATLEDLLKNRNKAEEEKPDTFSDNKSADKNKDTKQNSSTESGKSEAVSKPAAEEDKMDLVQEEKLKQEQENKNVDSQSGNKSAEEVSNISDDKSALKKSDNDTADDTAKAESEKGLAWTLHKADWELTFTAKQIQSTNFLAIGTDNRSDLSILLDKAGGESFNTGNFQNYFIVWTAYKHLKEQLDNSYVFSKEDMEELAKLGSDHPELVFLGAKEGTTWTIRDLFYAAVLADSAEAHMALAKLSSSTVEDFVKEMNKDVEAAGFKNTKLHDLYDIGSNASITNSIELAQLVAAMLRDDFLKELILAKSYNIRAMNAAEASIPIRSTYSDITAQTTFRGQAYIKAGMASWTEASSYAMLTIAYIKDLPIICISARAKDNYFRLLDHTGFYASGMERKHKQLILKEGERFALIKIKGSTQNELNLLNKKSVSVSLPELIGPWQLSYEKNAIDEIQAPAKAGLKLGNLTVRFGEEILYSYDYELDNDIDLFPLYKLNTFIYTLYFKNPSLFYVLMMSLNFIVIFVIVVINYFLNMKRKEHLR